MIVKKASHRTIINKDRTPGLMAYNASLDENRRLRMDDYSDALIVQGEGHHHLHEGEHFMLYYSVADLGAMTTPNDTITLSFKTPAASSGLFHTRFTASGPSGARVRFISGKTGGGTSPTGTLTPFNNNQALGTASTILAVDGTTANKVSYDATVFTGGTTLIDEYLTGAARAAGSEMDRGDTEIILAASTFYQLSIFGTTRTRI
jgi:hypothetical protein